MARLGPNPISGLWPGVGLIPDLGLTPIKGLIGSTCISASASVLLFPSRATELVAEKIIELAQRGVAGADNLSAMAVKELTGQE